MTETALIAGAEPWSSQGEGARAGTGVAVLHGFTGNPRSVRPLAERIHAAGFTVDMPLLPGHGTEWRDLAKTRYLDWRGAVEAVVDRLVERCDRVILVGLSLGGTLALDVGSRRPEDVAGIAAINPQILDPEQPLAKLNPILQYIIPAAPRDLAGMPSDDIAKPGADEGAYKMVPAKAAQSLISELPRLRAQLTDLSTPLLVAYSPQDHTVPAKNSEALVDLVASDDVETLVLERSYHVATLDWDQEQLEDAIVAFVERLHGG
ncbi:MAG: alpha/beta fold hydrolase [Nitriliruptorales bacterium]|nr:alpha/beta fold hydrolase [Nitriliruptorales bacterium]